MVHVSIENQSPIRHVEYDKEVTAGSTDEYDLPENRFQVAVICESGRVDVSFLVKDDQGNWVQDGEIVPLPSDRKYDYNFGLKDSSPGRIRIDSGPNGGNYTYIRERV